VFAIVNTPRNYPWGSTSAIARVLGVAPSGAPEAELWLGDHPGSPARVTATGESLVDWGAHHPERFGTRPLPFLLKLLAAESPLSIQAHPTREQALAGWERENSAGIALDSPERNYRDRNHKPEVIIALTEFAALCGFRPAAERTRIIDFLDASDVAGTGNFRRHCDQGLDVAVGWLLGRGSGVDEFREGLMDLNARSGEPDIDDAVQVATSLAVQFPRDPGAAVSLLLNHVVLQPGEALFLPAGNIHAYLHGTGIEVMAASDNVLRGGLTSKHIDVAELLAVLDFRELDEPRLWPDVSGTVRTFNPGLDDFAVSDIAANGRVTVSLDGPCVALVTDGQLTLTADTELRAVQGDALFIEAGETLTSVAGDGRIFVAHSPQRSSAKRELD
jgi:mannose-6-phosphate isomerase